MLRFLFSKILAWRSRNVSDENFMLILSIFVGIAGGLMALTLKTLVWHISELLLKGKQVNYFEQINFDNLLLLIYPSIGIILTVLMKKYIIKDKIKHNISSILRSISKRKSFMKAHKTFSSFLGGIFTASFGGSIGLESPIISSGAAIGSNIGRVFHLNYKQVTVLLACGSSGAIAAIFNTPIAAIVFAIEVLLIDLTRFSLIPLLLASVSGAIINKFLFKDEILIDFKTTDILDVNDIPFFVILGILSGFVSLYFTKTFLFIEKKFDEIKKMYHQVLIGGIILGVMIFLFPPLYGEGYKTIKAVLEGSYETVIQGSFFELFSNNFLMFILFFLLLILFKVIATATTFSAGGIGGIFAPSLFTGAILGFVFARTINVMNFGINIPESEFALVGMACLLGGVLHAPLTGIFLIAEITGGYELILPLMLSTTISFVTVKFLVKNSIFTMQLVKTGELITHHKDKAILTFMNLESVIEKDFLSISEKKTLGDLVKVISKSKRNIFPVLDDNNNLVGVVYLDKIRELMFNTEMYGNTYVSNLMITPQAFININDSMDSVMNKFQETNAWNLPVVENRKYVGFVSKSKLFSVYRKHLIDISEE